MILRNWSKDYLSIKRSIPKKKVAELIGDPNAYFDESFVKQLSKEKEFELVLQLHSGDLGSRMDTTNNPPETVEFDRNRYKETWNSYLFLLIQQNFSVTGDRNEKGIKGFFL